MEIGKVLVARHGARIGRMQHRAAVAQGPGAGIAGRLLADEAVFDHQPVVGERVLIEEVSELAVEALVLVVAHLEQAVFDAEGVAEVVAELVFGDLRRPALQILAVEQHDPVFLLGRRLCRGAAREQYGEKKNKTAEIARCN